MGNSFTACIGVPQSSLAKIKQDYRDPEKNTVIKKDETVEIVDEKSEEGKVNYSYKDYSLVKNSAGTIILVPNELLIYDKHIEHEEWFFGNITRFVVEQKYLTRDVEDGTFLVRYPSTDHKSKYVISVKKDNGTKYVYHYPIQYKFRQFYINQMSFPTVVKIIDHFRENRGLETKLVRPCTKEKPEQVLHNLSPIYSLDWEINRNEIEIKELLGKGNYGEVYRGRWKDTTDVAIKQLVTNQQFDKDAFFKEVTAMKKLRHDNIILLYGVCTKQQPYLLINEYASYGDLKQHLVNTEPVLEDLISMSFQIANGMKYLEKQNIIHRDLAARNILLDESLKVKIGDFGLSRVLVDDIYIASTETAIAIRWAAPEVMLHKKFSIKSDVWSFGVVLYEMFSKATLPYKDVSNKQMYKYVVIEKNRLEQPMDMPEDVYQKCLECWNIAKLERPSFKKLANFFEQYNSI